MPVLSGVQRIPTQLHPPPPSPCVYICTCVCVRAFLLSHASSNPRSSLRLLQMALFVVITRKKKKKKSNHTWTLSNYPLAHIPTGARSRWVCSSTWPSLPRSFHPHACTGGLLASAGYPSLLRRDTQNTYPPCLTHMRRSG